MSDWTGDNNSVFKALGASNHADKDRVQNDFYATDPIAIKKLEAVFPINVQVWEPACGMGHLSKALEDSGHFVVSTDKVYRGFGSEADFLKETVAPFENGFDIITNPPYKYAKEFVLHALNLVPDDGRVIMFLKTTFLEGKARKKEIYDVTPPRWVYQFSERVICAPNGDFEKAKKHSSAVAYAWFVWNKYNKEKITEVKWL